jgi:hypothetical protein
MRTFLAKNGMLNHVLIGAGVTYEDALGALARHWPEFGRMLRRLGSRQIRNRGTLGGNVANASPIGDTPPALIALDATLVVHSDKASGKNTPCFNIDTSASMGILSKVVTQVRARLKPAPAEPLDSAASALCCLAGARQLQRHR